jgi:hypothetical protein
MAPDEHGCASGRSWTRPQFTRTAPATRCSAARLRTRTKARAAARRPAYPRGDTHPALACGSRNIMGRRNSPTPLCSCLRPTRYVRLRCGPRSRRRCTGASGSRLPRVKSWTSRRKSSRSGGGSTCAISRWWPHAGGGHEIRGRVVEAMFDINLRLL